MKRKIKWRNVILWGLVLACMGIIFYFSSQPAGESDHLSRGVAKYVLSISERVSSLFTDDVQAVNRILRKVAHFSIFLCLGFLLSLAWIRFKPIKWYSVVLVLMICIMYAIFDETHQLYVPGRGCQVRDVLIDTSGSIVGISFYLLLRAVVNVVKKGCLKLRHYCRQEI